MGRRRNLVVTATILGAAVALFWALTTAVPSTSSGQDALAGRSLPPRPEPKMAPAPSPELPTPSEPEDPEPEPCASEILEANRLASEVVGACEVDFAEEGLCVAPVPFEHPQQASSQTANLRDWLAPCGLDASQLVFECSENPCVALVNREAVLAGAARCEPLDSVGQRLPEIDQEIPPEGIWSRWTPVVLDTPADAVDNMRAISRFNARVAQAERLLADEPGASSDVCEQARTALVGLKAQDPCGALREYWDCSPSSVELPPGTAESYASYGEARLNALLETCPAFAESNFVFDCSGVPCILLIDLLPDQTADDVLCGRPFGSIVFDQNHPGHISIWMYQGIDQPVFDRFEEELPMRNPMARAQLEAQRMGDQ